MNKKPLVSINILSFNRRDVLRYTLTKVFEQNYDNIEVIVVDNSSNDGTPNMIISQFPNVKLIKLTRNIGIAGYNLGFKEANGEYILLLDDDSYPKPNILDEGIKIFKSDSSIGIVAFNIMNEEESKSETENFDEYPTSFMGCGSLIARNLYLKIGGYDENYFLYDNELDYAARCLDSGYKIYYMNNSNVIHLQSHIARGRPDENILQGRSRYYHFFLSYSKFVILRLNGLIRVKALAKWLMNRTIIMIRFGFIKEYFLAIHNFLIELFRLYKIRSPINNDSNR